MKLNKFTIKYKKSVVNYTENLYLLREIKTFVISRANNFADKNASSGALPAVPTSINKDPVVACWLYLDFRNKTGRIKVG